VLSDDAVLIEQKANWRRKDPVFFRKLPLLLKDDGKLDSVLFRFLTDFFYPAARHHDHREIVVEMLAMDPDQVRREFIARPAVRVTEDEEHSLAPVLLEGDWVPVDIG
jgi:hypothetical protein